MVESLSPSPVPAGREQEASDRPGSSAQAFRLISLMGSLLVTVGSFCPWAILWVNGYQYSTSAFDGGDGAFVLGFGLVLGCLAVARLATKNGAMGVLWLQLVLAIFVACLAVGDMNAIVHATYTRMQGDPDPTGGVGIWMALLGGVVTVVGSMPALAELFRGNAKGEREHKRLAARERYERELAVWNKAEAARLADLQRLRDKYRDA